MKQLLQFVLSDVCGPVSPRLSHQQTGVIFAGSGNVNFPTK